MLTGSHVDTTLNAGAYDGVLGVLGAIEAVESLRAAGFAPRRSIEVIAWAGEEPRFGTGCVGSRCAAGELTRADLDRLVDRDGVSMASALRLAGFDPDRLAEATIDPAGVHALVELHIEQAIVLETHGEPIGVVEAIAAPHDFRLTFEGAATHAGATPMALRHDALVGAAEAIVAIERIATDLDLRHDGRHRRRPCVHTRAPSTSCRGPRRSTSTSATASAGARGRRRRDRRDRAGDRRRAPGSTIDVEEIVTDTPVACDPAMIDATVAACEALGLPHRRMISGAYHDAMIMGRHVPVGMIFVPSRDGVSHHPDEYTSPHELDQGVAVLAGTLERLAGG